LCVLRVMLGKRTVALLGVQLAYLMTLLLVAACVLLCLLAIVAHLRQQSPARQILQPVYARKSARRASGRSLPADLTPLPSRDPPAAFPPHGTQQGPDPNLSR
jgi:hypothetical protein